MNARVQLLQHGPSSAADPTEHRRFGGAFSASAGFHIFVAGLLLFITYVAMPREEEAPVIFELVEGEGDDFSATDAPSGEQGGLAALGEIALPKLTPVPQWTPPVTPAAPAPPPTPVPVAPVAPAPPQPTVSAPPTPNFSRQIKTAIRQEQRKVERELKQQREAEERAAKAEELASKRVSFDDFAKANAGKTNPAQRPTPVKAADDRPGPRLDPDAIKKGVAGAAGAGSKGAGGTALSVAERDRMKAYFAMLIQRLREAHEKPPGISDLLSADVSFTVTAGGAITGVRILRSSGNAEFDRSVQEAFGRVRMPARPDGKSDVQELTFRIREA